MPYRSPHAPLAIPPTPLADFVLAGAAARGQRAALIDAVSGRTISYAELLEIVARAAASLQRLGIAKGDVCAIFAPNAPEYVIAVLALARLGVDRLKELIKYKGMQVPPAELEAVLLSHPAVADTAVVPFADAEAGEIPRAFVVLKGTATADELMAYVASRVASYKKVRRVEFIDTIPKSASGKILRRMLKDRPAV